MTHRFSRRYWITCNHLIYRRRAFSQLYDRRRKRHAASGIKSRIYFFLRLILIPRNRLKIASPMLTKPRAHRIASHPRATHSSFYQPRAYAIRIECRAFRASERARPTTPRRPRGKLQKIPSPSTPLESR